MVTSRVSGIFRRALASAMVLLFALVLVGCATSHQVVAEKDSLFSEFNGLDDNVYVGVSGPYYAKDKAIEAAILSCAKNMLLHKSISMDCQNVLIWADNTEKSDELFRTLEKGSYSDAELTATVNAMEIVSLSYDNEMGAVVYAKLNGSEGEKKPYTTVFNSDGVPEWVGRIDFQIPGYKVGVGDTLGYYYFDESLEASDFDAAVALVSFVASDLTVRSIVKTNNDVIVGASNQRTVGLLEGFQVIDRWYDKKNNWFWSLAVVPDVD